ncbi:MAG: hypothetical protein J5J06_13700 [Phycisphaerae bacterium]|nr:hypothetical protein [Phycisphaerae bacterium]
MNDGCGVPLGGFVFVSAAGLLGTWWAYKRGSIEFRDFRVWLATHELAARRCGIGKGRSPRFQVAEISSLLNGMAAEHVRASIRRLERATLLVWSETAIRHPRGFDDLSADAQQFAARVQNHRRKIPVPRRLLRFLVGEGRPVLVATAIGHLLRCMYYRKGSCSPSGLCKATWIADRLKVDARNVKAARQELERLGILIRDAAPQTKLNRFGVPMRFNLAWGAPVQADRNPPPPKPLSTTAAPPPRRTGISLPRSKNQKPGTARPHGVRKRTEGSPSLSRVLMCDLQDPKRLMVLHQQARQEGLVGNSEAERLKFFAAAEHAKSKGTNNPPGLFVAVIRRGLFGYISQAEEENARARIRISEISAVEQHQALTLNQSGPVEADDTEERLQIRERIRMSLETASLAILTTEMKRRPGLTHPCGLCDCNKMRQIAVVHASAP